MVRAVAPAGRERPAAGNRLSEPANVRRLHAIHEAGEVISAAAEEVKRHLNLTRLLVGHRADVPDLIAAAGDDDVLADLAAEHAGFVPARRHDFEEHRAGL